MLTHLICTYLGKMYACINLNSFFSDGIHRYEKEALHNATEYIEFTSHVLTVKKQD